MTGFVSGVATRFDQVSKPCFIRICRVGHRLEIALQEIFAHFGNDAVYHNLTAVISYLLLAGEFNCIHEVTGLKGLQFSFGSMSDDISWFKAKSST